MTLSSSNESAKVLIPVKGYIQTGDLTVIDQDEKGPLYIPQSVLEGLDNPGDVYGLRIAGEDFAVLGYHAGDYLVIKPDFLMDRAERLYLITEPKTKVPCIRNLGMNGDRFVIKTPDPNSELIMIKFLDILGKVISQVHKS